jgi:hypothetical protein
MIAVICDPGARGSGSVEDRKENQNLFSNEIQPHSAMGKSSMVANGRSQAAQCSCGKRRQEDFPAREWKKHYSHNSQNVDQKQIHQSLPIVSIRFPPGLCPGMPFRKR